MADEAHRICTTTPIPKKAGAGSAPTTSGGLQSPSSKADSSGPRDRPIPKKAARANTKPYRDPPHRPSVRACPTPYRARRRPRWWAMVSGATNNCLATLPSRLHRSRVRKRVRRPSAVSTDLQPYPRIVYIHRSIPPASDPHPKRSLPDCRSDAASGKSRKSNRVCMTARAHLVLWEAGLAGLI